MAYPYQLPRLQTAPNELVPNLARADQNALLTMQGRREAAAYPEDRNYLLQQRENEIADEDYARGRRPTAALGQEADVFKKLLPNLSYDAYLQMLPKLQQDLPNLGPTLPTREVWEAKAAQAGMAPEAFFEQNKSGAGEEKLTFEEQLRREGEQQRQKLGIAQEFETPGEDELPFDEQLKRDAQKERQKLRIKQEFETDEPPSFEQKKKLRAEFIKGSGTFVKVRDSYNRILAGENDPSGAGDVALVFNFMKMLDPGSVVRESEYAVAANAAGVPERMRAKYNRLLEGDTLSPATRKDFIDTAKRLFDQQSGSQKKLISEYSRLAKRSGIDAKDIIVDYTTDQRPKKANDYLKKFE